MMTANTRGFCEPLYYINASKSAFILAPIPQDPRRIFKNRLIPATCVMIERAADAALDLVAGKR
jgi:hypothetical protein